MVPPLFMNILVILIKKVTLLTGYATCMLNSLSDTINISFPCNARPRRKLLLIHLRISQTHSLRLSMLTFHHRQLSVMYLPAVLSLFFDFIYRIVYNLTQVFSPVKTIFSLTYRSLPVSRFEFHFPPDSLSVAEFPLSPALPPDGRNIPGSS